MDANARLLHPPTILTKKRKTETGLADASFRLIRSGRSSHGIAQEQLQIGPVPDFHHDPWPIG
jgi:hypothetical protein